MNIPWSFPYFFYQHTNSTLSKPWYLGKRTILIQIHGNWQKGQYSFKFMVCRKRHPVEPLVPSGVEYRQSSASQSRDNSNLLNSRVNKTTTWFPWFDSKKRKDNVKYLSHNIQFKYTSVFSFLEKNVVTYTPIFLHVKKPESQEQTF